MSKMKLIVFVRHAESESNKHIHDSDRINEEVVEKINSYDDPNLTERGYRQAQVTAKHLVERLKLKEKKVNVLVSPFSRTWFTSLPLLNMLNEDHTLKMCSELQEYTSPKKKISKRLLNQGFQIDREWLDFIDRVLKFKDILKEEVNQINDEDVIVIYGHSLFLSVLISHLTSGETFIPSADNISIQLPNCSVTCFEYIRDKKWIFYVIGNHQHLGELSSGFHISIGF